MILYIPKHIYKNLYNSMICIKLRTKESKLSSKMFRSDKNNRYIIRNHTYEMKKIGETTVSYKLN